MTGERRKFQRQGEEVRRDALIAAALQLVAEGGLPAATVRAIAQRAGVTPGLIRHYFHSKEDLTRAAYAALMARMTEDYMAVPPTTAAPAAQLAAFVVASLRPPVVDSETLGLWAAFLQGVRTNPQMRAVHATGYIGYRDRLQALIADLPGRPHDPAKLRAEAIACNAVIDGLWLEGSALPDAFTDGELPRIGLTAVGAILGIDLHIHLHEETA